ncbi:MAG: hypothetical protein ACLRM9_00395 [Collinsella aerofaciens]
MRGGIVKRGTPVESGVVYVDGLRIGDTDLLSCAIAELANDGMATAVVIAPCIRRSRPSSSLPRCLVCHRRSVLR